MMAFTFSLIFSTGQQQRHRVVLAASVAFILFLSQSSIVVTSFQPTATWGVTTSRTKQQSEPPRIGSFLLRRGAITRPADDKTFAEEKEQASKGQLKFNASVDYLTRSVPLPCTRNKDVVDFFQTDAYLLLPAGTNNKIAGVKPATPQQLKRWKEEAKWMRAATPEEGDQVLELSVTTPFLVFTVHVVATIGFKLVLPSPGKEQQSPEYQFIWIDHKFYAEGPPPLVFLFDKIAGLDRGRRSGNDSAVTRDRAGKFEQPNHGIYRVKSVVSDDGTRMAFALRMASELTLKFPKALLQILPVEKKIIEEKGSRSLNKSMQRDLPPGIEAFREAYLEWLEA